MFLFVFTVISGTFNITFYIVIYVCILYKKEMSLQGLKRNKKTLPSLKRSEK